MNRCYAFLRLFGLMAIAGASQAFAAISIDTVPIGNPGNPAAPLFPRPTGSVGYSFGMGKTEVTNAQYVEFLNAVAADDTYGLYDTSMGDWGGIVRSGTPGGYTYAVKPAALNGTYAYGNKPVVWVEPSDGMRFANWLHNAQPSGAQDAGTTEDGAYTLNGATSPVALPGVTRNPGARWWLPSEDEWYKAAYHKNDGVTGNYWGWPTGIPGQLAPNNNPPSSDTGDSANFLWNGNFTTGNYDYPLTDAGAYTLSASAYGTFDQGGNVHEFTDTLVHMARRCKQTSSGKRAGFRPQLESLEGRWLLSTLTVTSPGDSGTGSLRAMIAAAESGDTIVFSPLLFSSTQTSGSTRKGNGKGKSPPPPPPPPPNTIVLTSGQLTLTRNLTIQGLGADQLTISGNETSRIFEVAQGATVTLSGLTISKGWYPVGGYGGGILNNGTLTVSHSTVAGSGARYGGGIYNAGGTLTVNDNSTLSGNSAGGFGGGFGGGIYNGGGTVTVSNSTVFSNESVFGGGIYNGGGTLTLDNSTLSSNSARADYNGRGGYGGGIYNSAGMVIISNSILSGNFASRFGYPVFGGGIYNAAEGTVTVKNSSSITGNTYTSEGGGGEDVRNLGVLYLDGTSTIGVLTGNPAILI